jgi:hypothetical protein
MSESMSLVPSAAPSTGGNDALAPTPASGSTSNSGETNFFGWLLFWIFFIPISAFILWRLWTRYKRRYEQRMLDYRSAQADRVLGDMQMVPNEDLDNELI